MTARLWLYLAAAAAIGGLLWIVDGWRRDSNKLESAEARTAQIERDAKATIAEMERRYAESQQASEGYQNELQTIRNRPISVSPVRLCKQSSVPKAGPAPSGSGSTIPRAEPLPEPVGSDPEPGPDIGPSLRELAKRCDEVSAQGRAIQVLF